MHRAKINEIGSNMEKLGYSVEYERYIPTPGGLKNGRFADIFATTPQGNEIIVQVGRQTKSGLPVIRERRAIQDLWNVGKNTFFVPYA